MNMNTVEPSCHTRWRTITVLAAGFVVSASLGHVDVAGTTRHSVDDTHGRIIQVPFDHDAPALGEFALYYELGAPFDPNKPTIVIATDAQQFYVQKGTVSRIQSEIFGSEFNVVGIPGRGASNEILNVVIGDNGEVDWPLAYRFLNSNQWVEDIEHVRRDLVGPDTPVLLYGRSGGGHLVHEYLAKHGRYAERAFSQAACNSFLDAEFGLRSDRFWEEIGAYDAALQDKLLEVLARRGEERPEIVQLFQRQNFFVSSSEIADARAALIEDLYARKDERIKELREAYQVAAVQGMLETPRGVGIRVRLYEFYEPVRNQVPLFGDAVHPDLENTFNIAQPLVQLREMGRLPDRTMDLAALHTLQTEVFVLAARWDHTCDYRSQIALASHYSRRALFFADDGHMFVGLTESNTYPELVRTFLLHGISSRETTDMRLRIDHLGWREQ